jgi:hypothetical protein
VRIEFESGTFQLFYLYFVFHWRIVFCLSRGVKVAGVAWRAAIRIMAGVGNLVQRTEDGRTGQVLGGWAIERSGDTVCGLHYAHGDEKHRFLGLLSLKTKVDGFLQFSLKISGDGFLGFASKPVVTVSPDLASKPVAWVSWFGPQNRSYGLVIWASKSLQRFLGLGLKIKEASVCQLCHKIDRGRMARDTRRDLVACFA